MFGAGSELDDAGGDITPEVSVNGLYMIYQNNGDVR